MVFVLNSAPVRDHSPQDKYQICNFPPEVICTMIPQKNKKIAFKQRINMEFWKLWLNFFESFKPRQKGTSETIIEFILPAASYSIWSPAHWFQLWFIRGPSSCHCTRSSETWLQTLILLTIENEAGGQVLASFDVIVSLHSGEWPSGQTGSVNLRVRDSSVYQWSFYLQWAWEGLCLWLLTLSVGSLLSCQTK